MSTSDTSTLLAQLRTVLDLTNTEIQIAETRVAQARTEAVRTELTQNAENGRERAEAIESTIRSLGGYPDVLGPILGRAAAAVKALTEQAEPFEEALLGDLALEDQLLDRARYIKALAVAAKRSEVEKLAERLIVAHSATVQWLTTVLAEDALGGPAALRRTPLQAATGAAVKLANLPLTWSTRGVDRALELLRSARPAIDDAVARGAHAGEIAGKALAASRDGQGADRLGRHPGDRGLRGGEQEPRPRGVRRTDSRSRHRSGGRRHQLTPSIIRTPPQLRSCGGVLLSGPISTAWVNSSNSRIR
jgi:hypothetical protein